MPAKDRTTSKGGVYAIRHIESGKVYIGSAAHIRKRWAAHRFRLSRGTHDNPHLLNAWQKYGADAFIFEVLEVILDTDDLLRVEQEWLDRIRPFDPAIGYNILVTAGSPRGMKLSPETRAKISAANKGQMPTAKARAATAAANRTRVMSAEARAKISKTHKGRTRTVEVRARMAAAQKGRYPTPETRVKLSAAQKARKPPSAETRAKMSAAHKGKPVSPGSLAALAAGRKKRGKVKVHRNQKTFDFME